MYSLFSRLKTSVTVVRVFIPDHFVSTRTDHSEINATCNCKDERDEEILLVHRSMKMVVINMGDSNNG